MTKTEAWFSRNWPFAAETRFSVGAWPLSWAHLSAAHSWSNVAPPARRAFRQLLDARLVQGHTPGQRIGDSFLPQQHAFTRPTRHRAESTSHSLLTGILSVLRLD